VVVAAVAEAAEAEVEASVGELAWLDDEASAASPQMRHILRDFASQADLPSCAHELASSRSQSLPYSASAAAISLSQRASRCLWLELAGDIAAGMNMEGGVGLRP
jgi:hypothetical protein